MRTRARTGPLAVPHQIAFLEIVAALLTTNPFSPPWVDRIKAALGDRFRPGLPVWCSRSVELDDNHRLLGEQLAALLPGLRDQLRAGAPATARAAYQGAAILALYGNFARLLGEIVAKNGVDVPFWGRFEKGYTALLGIEGLDPPPASSEGRAPSSRQGRGSDRPPEGRILGPDALTRGMSLDDWKWYLVTKTYAQCGRNQNETARRLKINWRTAARWIDHGLLERWAARRGG